MDPKVSLIIRTFNEVRYIKDLLISINQQSYKSKEIIIVDSGSFDGTIEIAKEFGDKLITINQNDFTFGFAINYGIKHAMGDYICIVSAHTLPTNKHWLSALVEGFNHHEFNGEIAMTYGKQVGDKGSNYGEIRDFNRQFNNEETTQKKPHYFCNNANSMIRKDLWSKHPFDEALTGLEDIEWSKYWLDKGYKILYKPKAEIIHIHRETSDQIKRRFWREAIAARSIGVLPIHKLIMQVIVQIPLTILDLVHALLNDSKERWAEIISFRKNKALGVLKALPHKKLDLRDYSAHYAPLDYKVIEFNKQNRVRETVYPIESILPNNVLIEVCYVGVCETDFEVLRGDLNFYKSGLAKYPIIPGHEFSGRVVRIGSKSTEFKSGDRVVGQCILSCGNCDMCFSGRETACTQRKEVGVLNQNGAYAEYITLPTRFVHKIPQSLSLISASSIEPLAVVLKGMRRLDLDKLITSDRENILVVGAGPIGHLCARVGYFWGHNITVMDKNNYRLNFLSDIDISLSEEINNYNKFSVIIECTGNADIAELIINKSSSSSNVLLLGLPYDKKIIDLENIVSSDKKIIGSVGSNTDDFRKAISITKNIDLNCFNNSIYPFCDWKEAWEMHKNKRELKVKLQIKEEIIKK